MDDIMGGMKQFIDIQTNVTGLILVFYFGNLIAVVSGEGKVIHRNPYYPMFLVEYLIENPPHQSRWN